NPTLLSGATLADYLGTTALDIEAAGVDRDSGHGIVDALAAVKGVSPAFLNSPAATTFTSTAVTFVWSKVDFVSQYNLTVGSSPGASDIFSSAAIRPPTNPTVTAGGIPS